MNSPMENRKGSSGVSNSGIYVKAKDIIIPVEVLKSGYALAEASFEYGTGKCF